MSAFTHVLYYHALSVVLCAAYRLPSVHREQLGCPTVGYNAHRPLLLLYTPPVLLWRCDMMTMTVTAVDDR
jgi:hypothetical protein